MDIRATSTYQHYDQEYNFLEADPMFGPSPRTMYRIPVGDPKQRAADGAVFWSGSVDGHLHPPLLSILLANVQSLDNKVDEI